MTARGEPRLRLGNFPGEWAERGACRGTEDPDAWFPTVLDGSHGQATRFGDAVRTCHACPVESDCLEYALEAGEHHGIWGGTSERERRRIRRERAKGKRAA